MISPKTLANIIAFFSLFLVFVFLNNPVYIC